MTDEARSDGDREDDLALLAVAKQAPFPLFGLTDQFRGTRELNGVGPRHVGLSHGLWTDKRVDVSVTGPLHGQTAGGEWSSDPLPTIAVELLNRTGFECTTAEELMKAAEDVLRRDFSVGEVLVDGERWPFRFLREGAHWAALHDLPPDHLLYVVASNVEPSEIELTRLDSLAAYA